MLKQIKKLFSKKKITEPTPTTPVQPPPVVKQKYQQVITTNKPQHFCAIVNGHRIGGFLGISRSQSKRGRIKLKFTYAV